MSGWNLTQYTLLTYSTRKFYSPSFISSFKTFGFVVYKGGSTLLQICQESATMAGFLLHSCRKVVPLRCFYIQIQCMKKFLKTCKQRLIGWNFADRKLEHIYEFLKTQICQTVELKACLIDKKKEFRIKAYNKQFMIYTPINYWNHSRMWKNT